MRRFPQLHGAFTLLRMLPLLDVLESPVTSAVEAVVEASLSGTPAPDAVLMALDDYREASVDVCDVENPVYLQSEMATHSILDIQRVVRSTAAPSPRDVEDYGTLRPIAHDRILRHFGTDRPTPGQFGEVLDHARTVDRFRPDPEETLMDECHMRWTGVYVVLYTGEEPTHLGTFGYSGD